MKKRILSILLAMVMVLSMVPASALSVFAAEGTSVAKVGDVEYVDFASAVANWTDGTTLTLLADEIELAEQIELSSNGLVLDLNGKKLKATVDEAIKITAGELTIRDSVGTGSFTTTKYGVLWAHGGNVNFESGTLESVTVSSGTFNMTGGTVQADAFVGIYVNGEATANISGGEIKVTGNYRDGIYNLYGTLNVSGAVKITSENGAAISNYSSSILTTISGNVVLDGLTGELELRNEIVLNTQPTGDAKWDVNIDTGEYTGIENGVFAIPGDGVTLDPAKFTSSMDGYEVKLNSKNELVLCSHSAATVAIPNGNGTHNTTCDCNETTFESNVVCSGGVATATRLAVCAYCGGTYGELDANVNYDIIATAMTAAELKAAVAAWLNDGNTDMSILLAAYADEEMFTAVKTALAESTVADGSINLTLAGVKTIPDEALSDYPISIGGNKLKSLTLTDAETTGAYEPFARCTYLESVSLPNATTIGRWTFNGCSNLTSVYCPKVTVIGENAFWKCAKLTTFDFTNITTIGNSAFSGCDFSTVVLPEVASIGGGAFVDNPNLVSFSAPKATSLGWYPWGAVSIESSKLETLELTAPGDFIIENNFSAYTPFEQINLVLNIDKKDQVTQNDDGTAAWTYTYTYGGIENTQTRTFKSITFACIDGTTNHSYTYTDNGDGTHSFTCSACDLAVTEDHTPNETIGQSCKGYKCTVCGNWYGEVDTDNHAGALTAKFTWYDADNGECYVEATLHCQGCGEDIAYNYGYGKLTGSVEATDCMNPGSDTYEITLELDGEKYSDSYIVKTISDKHADLDDKGFCSACGGYEAAVWNGEKSAYEISNAGQLYWYAQHLNATNAEIYAELTANIIIPENAPNWEPINATSVYFNGNFHTISGLKCIGDENMTYVGLFGCEGWWYEISNLHIEGGYFEGNGYVGAVVACMTNGGSVTNCAVTDTTVKGNGNRAGTLAGYLSMGSVINCFVDTNTLVGGYINGYATIENSYYLSDTETEDGGKTAQQFASGEVAYLLQAGIEPGGYWDENGEWVETEAPLVWGQKIGTDTQPVLGGMKVYLLADSTYSNGEVEKFDIDVARMILGNALEFQFGVRTTKIPDKTGYYAVVEKAWADGTTTTETIPAEQWGTAGTYHAIVYEGLAAKEMNDTISVTIYNAKDQAVSNAKQDSVVAYVTRAYASQTATGKTMMVDMLNYGAAAQVHFSYDTDNLCNAGLTDAQKAVATAATPEMSNDQVKGTNYQGTRFLLTSAIQVQLGFKQLTTDMYAIYIYQSAAGEIKEVRVEGADFVESGGTKIGVELSTLVYADARALVDVVVYKADGTVHATASDSIESACARSTGDVFVELMKFADSAKAHLYG